MHRPADGLQPPDDQHHQDDDDEDDEERLKGHGFSFRLEDVDAPVGLPVSNLVGAGWDLRYRGGLSRARKTTL